jgi:hypothetical protein
MNCFKHLKDEVYYSDLYDRMTVEECRALEKRFAEAKVGSSTDQVWQKFLVESALYFLRGERYAAKSDMIMLWRGKDRQRDEKLANTSPPRNIRCLTCFSEMACEEKDLQERDGCEQVLFFFICPKCDSRRAFYEDGTEYRHRKILCSQCQGETKTDYQRTEKEINVVVTCANCGKVETELLTSGKPADMDENYAADRERFCMSEEEGQEYFNSRSTSQILEKAETERQLRQKRQNLYDEISKLKKLMVVDLQNLLIPALERERFLQLDFGKPDVKRDVQIPFTVQDAKSGRSDRDSVKILKQTIEETLNGTNWKLMSSGINYHLGVLGGLLRGLETEKDLLALVRMRLKT